MRDVSSQDSIVPVFSRVGARISSFGHAFVVISLFTRVCRTLGSVQELIEAASRT